MATSWSQSLNNAMMRIAKSTPPQSANNVFPLVWDYLVADRMTKIADARKKAALAALQAEGVLQQEYEPGVHLAFNADGLSLVVRRNNDTETLDKAAVINALHREFGSEVAKRILKAASKPRKGAQIVEVGYQE